MGKIKNFVANHKKISAVVLAGSITLGTLGGTIISTTGNYGGEKSSFNNEIGYENINPFFTLGVEDDNFVVLDAGDHDSFGTLFLNRKIKLCNKNDISVGVIINSDSENESSIYDDVEYVKGIIRDYKIDFPVYLNIDNIITNDNLNIEMKTKLLKDFLEKCSANNIYVGLYGTDTNLCRVKEYCGITGYDAYLVMDNDTVQYDGTYNIYKDLDGVVRSDTDLSSAISNKNLNDSSNFSSDGTYTLNSPDEIIDVSLKYGLSVNEILKFNGLSKDKLEDGTVIRIPSVIAKNITSSNNNTYEKLDTPIRGCDMSYAQDIVDWDAISDNFEYVILRSNLGLSIDSNFEEYAAKCNLYNIPVGVYCFNKYFKTDDEDLETFKRDQKKQCEYTLSLLNNKKIQYPIFLDIEKTGLGETNLPKEYLNVMLDIWSSMISEAGYIPGIYCNSSAYDYICDNVDYDLSSIFQVWVAGGNQYGNEKDPSNDVSLSDVKVPSTLGQIPGVTIFQATNCGTNAGATNSDGHLDIDFSLIDYSKPISDSDEIDSSLETEIKDFNKFDYRMPVAFGAALASGSIIGIAGYKIRKKVKRK
jgi:GH25 family lysozyme M1 (1,4-beta-N-acetylmuramidase)